MLFNSYIFILLFLPLTVAGYFFLNRFGFGKGGKAGLIWLLLMSLWFYGYSDIKYLAIITLSGTVNYILTRWIGYLKSKGENTVRNEKVVLVLGILFHLGLLFYFKYFNFFMENVSVLQNRPWQGWEIILPLGISFITFSQISYLTDCYRSEEGFKDSLTEYALWLCFFPKLSSGPIVLREELVFQFGELHRKKPSFSHLSEGLYEFALGLAKKVLLADTLAKIVNAGFSDISQLRGGAAWLIMLAYSLQLYFDFSGYCDMGLGIARMLNFDMPLNFNSPYKAGSVSEFWSRWHMSLTRFFTRYVYIPLGGSKNGRICTYRNTLLVFLLSGLWHGASWTFVIWGGLHGIFMVLEKFIRDVLPEKTHEGKTAFKKIAGGIYTFLFVNLAWIFFRSSSLKEAGHYLAALLTRGRGIPESVSETVNNLIEVRFLSRLGLAGVLEAYPSLAAIAFILLSSMGVFLMKNTQKKTAEGKYDLKRSLLTITLLVWCVISLSDVSTFLYFEF